MEKVIAFDLDGTVAETFPVIFDSFRKTVHEYTDKWVSNQVILKTFGTNEVSILKELIPDYSEDVLKSFHENYRRAHLSLRKPFEGIDDLIRTLHDRDVKTPMITHKGEQSLQASLDALSLDDPFSPILAGTPNDADKSHQFEKVLAELNVPASEMAYIGDAPSDITACQEAGITCYSAAWSINAKKDDLEKLNPGNVFESVADLKNRLIH